MSARRLPPLMADNPRAVQIAFVMGAPVVFGAIIGVFLGLSETVYAVLSIIGVLGGVVAGFDHLGARAGARRGLLAGALFGASIVIAHELHGRAAKAHLPDPEILLVVITTVLGVAFAAAGGALPARFQGP